MLALSCVSLFPSNLSLNVYTEICVVHKGVIPLFAGTIVFGISRSTICLFRGRLSSRAVYPHGIHLWRNAINRYAKRSAWALQPCRLMTASDLNDPFAVALPLYTAETAIQAIYLCNEREDYIFYPQLPTEVYFVVKHPKLFVLPAPSKFPLWLLFFIWLKLNPLTRLLVWDLKYVCLVLFNVYTIVVHIIRSWRYRGINPNHSSLITVPFFFLRDNDKWKPTGLPTPRGRPFMPSLFSSISS